MLCSHSIAKNLLASLSCTVSLIQKWVWYYYGCGQKFLTLNMFLCMYMYTKIVYMSGAEK